MNCLEIRIGSRQVAKQNSFNCGTWTGQAGRVVVLGDVRRESSGVSPERGGSVLSLKAEYNRISSKAFGQCLCGGRQVVVAQWNRNSRKESAVQQCESQVQAGKKLGVSGVDGESWFGDRSTLCPGHKPKRTRQTGQPGAPARQGASANYDSWRWAAGASERRAILVNHTQVVKHCSGFQLF